MMDDFEFKYFREEEGIEELEEFTYDDERVVLELIEMEISYGPRTCSGLRKSCSTILGNMKHQISSRS